MEYEIDVRELPTQPAAVVHGQVDSDGLPAFLDEAFGEVARVLAEEHLAPAGPPFGRYHAVGDGWDVEVGFPVSERLVPAGRVGSAVLPGGPAAHTLHVGAYGEVGSAYAAIMAWLSEHGMIAAGEPWETYLDGPDVPEPRTEVFVPCAVAGTPES